MYHIILFIILYRSRIGAEVLIYAPDSKEHEKHCQRIQRWCQLLDYNKLKNYCESWTLYCGNWVYQNEFIDTYNF